ncbi:MAG: protein tyrosine phosphatase [Deltaproteobacteria bacterium]|nr:protein tyrosine phosphatase [Deltaproteobacteria bacterium]
MSNQTQLASWVELEGCFNFRDLGGYMTAEGQRFRTGLVFRSDGLQHLTPADLNKLSDEIELGHVIDLRSQEEVDEVGRGPIAEQVTIHHVPLFAGVSSSADAKATFEMPADMGELYFLMLTFAQQPIAEVIRLLAHEDAPAVFHCAAGKDRTGVISAILLSLLGVPEDTIVADYAFSRQNIDLINQRLDQANTYQAFMGSLPEGAYDADPACMETFLRKVKEEHDSVEGWAMHVGLNEGDLRAMKEKLLES